MQYEVVKTVFEHPRVAADLRSGTLWRFAINMLYEYEYMGKELRLTVADFKGKRLPPAVWSARQKNGAVPTVPASETYNALHVVRSMQSGSVHLRQRLQIDDSDWYTTNMSLGTVNCPWAQIRIVGKPAAAVQGLLNSLKRKAAGFDCCLSRKTS